MSSIAGWSSLVARWAHNPKVAGSNPAPATGDKEDRRFLQKRRFSVITADFVQGVHTPIWIIMKT